MCIDVGANHRTCKHRFKVRNHCSVTVDKSFLCIATVINQDVICAPLVVAKMTSEESVNENVCSYDWQTRLLHSFFVFCAPLECLNVS